MKLRKDLKYTRSVNKNRIRRNYSYHSDGVIWIKANDIKSRVKRLIKLTNLPYNIENITTLRSFSSKSRAYARIWGLSKVWQISLNIKPHYIIEVLSEKFDNLSDQKKDEVILHEIAHIPHNFSGSLLPHIRRGKRKFSDKVDKLIRSVNQNSEYKVK